MDQRISIITLGVSDLKKSRDFYDSLGWSVASNEDTEDIICYNLNGMSFALFPRDGLAEDAGGGNEVRGVFVDNTRLQCIIRE